jgi:ferritin-like metal-binding protein YciE
MENKKPFSEDGHSLPPKKIHPASSEGRAVYELMLSELKKIYWIQLEKQRMLKMYINSTETIDVILEFEDILNLTKRKIKSAQELFKLLNVKSDSVISMPVATIFRDAEKAFNAISKPIARDAILILAIQQVEHFEIATYSMLISLNNLIGDEKTSRKILNTLLNEEEAEASLRELGTKIIEKK